MSLNVSSIERISRLLALGTEEYINITLKINAFTKSKVSLRLLLDWRWLSNFCSNEMLILVPVIGNWFNWFRTCWTRYYRRTSLIWSFSAWSINLEKEKEDGE